MYSGLLSLSRQESFFVLFTSQDIARAFDARDLNRGRLYQTEGHVLHLDVRDDGCAVQALVQGTLATPYRVKVTIEKHAGSVHIESHCTCPVGYMCKHGVAALYEAIAQENRLHEKIGFKKAKISYALSSWLETLSTKDEGQKDRRILYRLKPQREISITPVLQQRNPDGSWQEGHLLTGARFLTLRNYGPHLSAQDRTLLQMMLHDESAGDALSWSPSADGAMSAYVLTRFLESGRVILDERPFQPLNLGPPMPAKLDWDLHADGYQHATVRPLQEDLLFIMPRQPWYIDSARGLVGPLSFEEDAQLVQVFLEAPPVAQQDIKAVRAQLEKAKSPFPLPYKIKAKDGAPSKPAPHLFLAQEKTDRTISARLCLDYDGAMISAFTTRNDYITRDKETLIVHPRNTRMEQRILRDLEAVGLGPSSDDAALVPLRKDPWFWHEFLHKSVSVLEEKGFVVSHDEELGAFVVETDDDAIDADFMQQGAWWFSLNLGIQIEGKKVPLLPLLVAMIKTALNKESLENLPDDETCYAPLPDGRFVALEASRIRLILKTLIELFDERPLDKEGHLRLPLDLAAAFSRVESLTHKRWLGQTQMKALMDKLTTFEGIEDMPLPKGFRGELRPYQKEGYNWLHFLGTYGLSGILADDMGLGKTVQTLAYICAQKERGTWKKPCLIVMPTSLIANWQAEVKRFTPDLKILVLHGKDRARDFDRVNRYDLVFTTYPLLARDYQALATLSFSLVVLDEAQAIKNPAAKVTQASCTLQAQQRLCLTGTPVENHLGEAWSLFTFLMPGLLGRNKDFTRRYRTPIEKGNDEERKDLLARRLRPFVLRRLKNDVARELPPKTEIMHRITLADEQRDLYEAVRHVMSDRVREEIAAKGLARSRIVVLDALLKLRQICCDPRLVKLDAARHVKSSAKLETLLTMLSTMIEEGRHILLFSQFTSMLDLIKDALEKAAIPYVELHGGTKDRATPIARFQKGEVPLFLISLKAGGTGLNLTAADTVIHYDPWWNPSVENQATDRAHRIGQDKPVFVYKLIAEGTVEERIVALQERKAGLADALFAGKPAAAAQLTAQDISWLMGDG